jgi:hypothetical protein
MLETLNAAWSGRQHVKIVLPAALNTSLKPENKVRFDRIVNVEK